MENDLIFRILLGLLFVAFVAHRGYYTSKYNQSGDHTIKARESSLVVKLANALSIPALLATVIYIFYPPWMAWSSLPFPVWLRWLGVMIAIAGFALLQWSQVALEKNWSDTPKLLQGQTLVTNGPYRWVRHPIYSAFLLIMGATLLISANWFIGGLWIGLTAVDVISRVRYEEALLLDHFGEAYRTYEESTGRLRPRWRRSSAG